MKQLGWLAVLCLVNGAFGQTLPSGDVGDKVPKFGVRPGYKVTLAASNVGRPTRFMEFDDHGDLFVSIPNEKKIVVLRDKDGDGTFETKEDFVTNHPTVHGLCYHNGELWFTESGAVFKTKVSDDGKAGDVQTIIPNGELPSGGGHWFRSILVTDQYFFTSIGDDQNASEPKPDEHNPHREDREKIWRYKLDGSDKTLWCEGIRNTEKLRLRPGTDELWGCDHGSDNIGYDWGDQKGDQPITDLNPPEEINHYIQGNFYGHPYVAGLRMPRPEYIKRDDIHELTKKTTPPEWAGGAHWANNGWTFLTKNYFPDAAGDMFVAYHGSWDRNPKGGYCIAHILFDKVTGHPYGSQPIVTCLNNADPNGRVLDRPVDCVEAPDGSVLFSTDQMNNIYRISRE